MPGVFGQAFSFEHLYEAADRGAQVHGVAEPDRLQVLGQHGDRDRSVEGNHHFATECVGHHLGRGSTPDHQHPASIYDPVVSGEPCR